MNSKKKQPKKLSWLEKLFWPAWFMLLILGQFQRWQLGTTVAVYLHEAMMVLWLSYWLSSNLLSKNRVVWQQSLIMILKRHRTLLTLVTVWSAVAYASSFLQGLDLSELTRAWLHLGRWILYGFFLVGMGIEAQKKSLLKYYLKLGLLGAGLSIAWLGWWQYWLLPDTRFLAINGWDDHYFRLISTQFDPAYTGIILVLTGILIWSWPTHHHSSPVFPWLKRLSLWGVIACLSLTYARSVWITWLVVLGALSASSARLPKDAPQKIAAPTFKEKLSYICWTFLCFATVTFGTSVLRPTAAGEGINLGRTSTIEARAATTTSMFNGRSPLSLMIGSGPLVTPQVSYPGLLQPVPSHAQLPDSWPVTLVLGFGVLGSVLALAFLGHFLQYLWLHNPTWFVATLAVVLFGLTNNLLQPFVVVWWGMIGITTQQAPKDQ